jgi:hypothetical protein
MQLASLGILKGRWLDMLSCSRTASLMTQAQLAYSYVQKR